MTHIGAALRATRIGVALSSLILSASISATAAQGVRAAEVVSADVDLFWRAFDDAAKVPAGERSAVYAREYFDHGSDGLKDFIAFRKLTPEKLADHVERQRADYQKIRPYVGQVVGQRTVIEAAFTKLKELYPNITFPLHIYFVVGAQRGAGMNSDHGIVLAAGMFATPPGTPYSYTKVSPDYVPFSAVHETIHYSQVYKTNDSSTLAQNVVNEGTADFVTTLVLPQPNVRQMTDRWVYGCAHEDPLAARFARELDTSKPQPWLFDHEPATGWPPDMGYWLGYRIAQTFYTRATNKRAALRTLLEVTDFKAFLRESGYPEHKPACVPEAPRK